MFVKSTFNNCVIVCKDLFAEYSGKHEEKDDKEDNEDSDDADQAEVVEVQPQNANELTFIDCIAEKETAHILRKWLHLMMDKVEKPKPKLKFLRAIYEANLFSQEITHEIYQREFGRIASSSYYDWYLSEELRYDIKEIDKIVEQYQQYLSQFQK